MTKERRRRGYQSLQLCMEMLQSKFEVNSGLWAKELELKKDLMKTQMDQENEDRKREQK